MTNALILPARNTNADIVERWLSRTILAAGFSPDFAKEQARALRGAVRSTARDLAKMRADLAAMADP